MKKVAFSLLIMSFCMTGITQLVPQPTPLHKKDFKLIAEKRITVVYEYDISDDTKIITRLLEHGVDGLPAGLYQRGLNDNGDSANVAETIYKFDGAGRLIRESNKEVESDSWDKVYTYGKNGKLQKTVGIHIDPSTTIYTYDATGKLIKTYTTVQMPTVNKNGESTGKAADFPSQRETYMYDKAGNLKEVAVYYLRNTENRKAPAYKTRWTYNDKRQLIKFERINAEGAVYNTETFGYDSDGFLVKKTTQDNDEPVKTFVYEYCTTCTQSWMD